MADEDLLSAAEVAKRLGISTETVNRNCRTGTWKAAKIGRFYRFTEAQYQTIIEPPAPPKSRQTRRSTIERLLRSA